MALSAEATKILKTTAPVVREHGAAITTAMYRIMMDEHPEVKNLFNNSHLRKTEDGQVSPQVRFLRARNFR
jgi:nitric oxide dioxygenase